MGKENHRVNVKSAIAVLIGLAGCTAPTDGTYFGTLKTQQGLCSTSEDTLGNAPATLNLRGNNAQFEPEDGVIVLGGQMNNAGHVLAQSNAPGADHKPFPQIFEGDLVGDQISGRFASPRCRATITLKRR